MSHIVTIKTRMTDAQAISAACGVLRLDAPTVGKARVFETEKTGTVVRLKGWVFPVVIDGKTGELAYDNYGGRWGDEAQLRAFRQQYAIEKVRIEARAKGYRMTEQRMPDGTVKCQMIGM